MRCQAMTKRGQPCRGGAMKGQRFCGPHMDQAETSPVTTTMMDGVEPPDEYWPVATVKEKP